MRAEEHAAERAARLAQLRELRKKNDEIDVSFEKKIMDQAKANEIANEEQDSNDEEQDERKSVTWDLKRDLQSKTKLLQKQTDNAIKQMVKARLQQKP